jgi:hypothetical protein
MKKVLRIGIIIVVFLCFTGLYPTDAQQLRKRVTPVMERNVTADKFDRFIEDLSKARTADDILRALKRGGFTPNELNELQRRVDSSPYKTKLQNLLRGRMPSPRKPVIKQVSASAKLMEIKRRFAMEQKEKLARINRSAEQFLERIKQSRPIRKPIGKLGGSSEEAPTLQGKIPFKRPKVTLPVSPHIDEMSSNEIRPGQVLIITGSNFLTRGRVDFVFGSITLYGIVNEWHDRYISVTLDSNLSGYKRMTGIVKVINETGASNMKPITFIPAEEILELPVETVYPPGTHKCDYTNLLCYESAQFFCIGRPDHIVDKRVHLYSLKNNWVVYDYWLFTNLLSAAQGTCKYMEQPNIGTPTPMARIQLTIPCEEDFEDAVSVYSCDSHVLIIGPRGVRPYR